MAQVRIDANYPGGNIVLERIDGSDVHLRQDLRDTQGWWFYWNFRVRGGAGRTLRFRFAGRDPIGTRGPAVSTDGGRTWAWLGRKAVEAGRKGVSFRYTFAEDARAVRFCFAVPYQEADLRRFLKRRAAGGHLAVRELCKTRAGRPVERLHVGRIDGEPAHRVLLTCRHHACETMASYALEGALAAVLADTDDGRWLRENVEVLAVPFMDKDGVQRGDQGKNRKPRDHNRDYLRKSIYRSVKALRQFVPGWSAGRLKVALDLHCPWIRGRHNEVIYLVGSADKAIWAQQRRFGRILEAVRSGPLVYRTADNVPFGTSWNTAGNYKSGKSFSRWAGEQKGMLLASTIEIPYANVGRQTVTPEAARAFGADLMKAVRRYLEGLAAK